jgi:ABC-type sugar transport system permease subunit
MARSLQQPARAAQGADTSTWTQRMRRVLGPDWQVAFPFVLPMILLMAGLILYPFLDAVRLSFTTRTITGVTNFVGLQNYQDLLHDRTFKDAVRVSFIYTVYSILFKIVAGMLSALLLHNLMRGRSILTGLILLPWIIPTVVTALAWRLIYDPIFGGLNKILVATGLGNVLVALHVVDRVPASWLGSTALALPSIILVNVWKGIPFFTINLLAGLKSIDQELYEAASVDGATAWERFINVTIPGLRNVLLVTTLLSTIWTFNTFDIIYLLTGGGPGGTTRPFVIFAYEKAIQGLQFGAGAAVALLMVPIVNAFGFISHSRYLPDRRDLNRSFPGSAKGSLAAQLANLFLTEVVARSDYGIDLHSAAIHRSNLPQIRVDTDEEKALELARAFGAPIIVHSGLREGSLREAARANGVPVIVYEAGEGLRVDELSIRVGMRGVLRVMAHLGMMRRRRDPRRPEPVLSASSRWVRAEASGLFRPYKDIGDHVGAGQVIGIIADPYGERETELKASCAGIIIGRANIPAINQGDALFHIAKVEDALKVGRHLDTLERMLDEDEII